MQLDAARELKAQLWHETVEAAAVPRPALPCFVGVSVLGPGRYGLAVRHEDASAAAVAALALELAGDEADVREVGPVRALSLPAPDDVDPWLPTELRRRARPLRPGLSIAHPDVTAGTLGAFVRLADADGLFALSNNHVLADSDRGRVGDPVLQPGPADGGRDDDRVGQLARAVRLLPEAANTVDAAVALLDDPSVQAEYPSGRIDQWMDADDDVAVEKVGRTTGVTRGHVTAIELDDLTVEYPIGPVTFDGQLEVTGDSGAFSAGGDSGSLVYQPATGMAVGLLFAGSQRGGPAGTGLTYCNPIGAVLQALQATLLP